MATITVLSAKGSPGATTATVGLTMAWSAANPGRRAMAVDADPIGGDFAAGVLRGAVPTNSGILPLATSRGMDARAALDAACVHLRADGSAKVLPGVPDQARGAALRLAWDLLAEVRADLHHSGADILVDAGRVDRAGLSAPWFLDSDLAVLVVRPTLAGVMAAHRLAVDWPVAGVPVYLLVVNAATPYGVSEVGEAVGVPLLGAIAFDPASARVHSEGADPQRGFERSEYARSVRRAASDLGSLAIARADRHLPVPPEQVDVRSVSAVQVSG